MKSSHATIGTKIFFPMVRCPSARETHALKMREREKRRENGESIERRTERRIVRRTKSVK